MNYTEEHLSTLTDRELDALIAEHFFGYQWARVADTGKRILIPPDRIEELQRGLVADPRLPLSEAAHHYVPPYGRSYEAASLIVNELESERYDIRLSRLSGNWHCSIFDFTRNANFQATAEALPQVIRLAALLLMPMD